MKENGTPLNSVWEAVVGAAQKVDHQQMKELTGFMTRRLMTVIEKNGDYTVLVTDFFFFLISEMFINFEFFVHYYHFNR